MENKATSSSRKNRRTSKSTDSQQETDSTGTLASRVCFKPKDFKDNTISTINETRRGMAPKDSENHFDWERLCFLDLVMFDTDVDWSDLHCRLLANPSLAIPVPLSMTRTTRRTGQFESELTSVHLHERTLLGSLCSVNISADDLVPWRRVVLSALQACPDQVACSQDLIGHTALRDGVCNPNIPNDIIESMVEACPESVHIVDVDGLSPIDHVLFDSHLSKHQAEVGMDRIRVLLKHAPLQTYSSKSSPLIRFLSSGYSSKTGHNAKPGKLLQYCQLFIDWDPQMISTKSMTTSCSILHIAVRNYGNLFSFVDELLKIDGVRHLLGHRNRYGDLPLHVACAAGVPTKVLRLILSESLQVYVHKESPHPLIWTTNEAGYTPVDLEWIRQVEVGSDFFKNRGFYQLDARGIRTYGNAYDSLLRDTVKQVIAKERPASCESFLLERIFLIIKSATSFMFGSEDCCMDSDDFIFHRATALLFPTEEFLPSPIIEVILWSAPEQVGKTDVEGKTPLHYAVKNNTTTKNISGKFQTDWYRSVAMILQRYAQAVSLYDNDKMLPIHLLLRNEAVSPVERCSVAAFDKTLIDLVATFPQSLEIPDPATNLLPVHAAAQNELISLEATFKLLRANPGVLGRNFNSWLLGHRQN